MSAAEYDLWRVYYRRNGFTVDRIEWAVALGCSAVARALGADCIPGQFIPRFGSAADNRAAKIAGLSSVAGAQVTTGGRYRGK